MATRKTKTAPAEEIKAEETEQKTVTEPKEETFTKADVERMIAEAVASAMANMTQQRIASVPEKERVNLLWQAPVMDENVQEFGPNGSYARITGPTGSFWVPKEGFFLMIDAQTRMFLDRRWLIVLSGLDEDEREIYGVNYKPGEYLTRQAFSKLAEQGDKLLEIYPQLCKGNREIVYSAVYQGWKEGNKAINRGLVEELAALCRRIDPEETTFQIILQEMAEKAAQG